MTNRERFTKKRYEIQEGIDRQGGYADAFTSTIAAALLLIAEQLFEIREGLESIDANERRYL